METMMKHITLLFEVVFLVLKLLLIVIITHISYNMMSVLFQFFYNNLLAIKIL